MGDQRKSDSAAFTAACRSASESYDGGIASKQLHRARALVGTLVERAQRQPGGVQEPPKGGADQGRGQDAGREEQDGRAEAGKGGGCRPDGGGLLQHPNGAPPRVGRRRPHQPLYALTSRRGRKTRGLCARRGARAQLAVARA